MQRKVLTVLILLLGVYAAQSLYTPAGLMVYAFSCACWSLLAIATLWICGFEKIAGWFNRRLTVIGALIAVFQIFILISAGLLTAFGMSPYSFTPMGITINVIFVSTTLLGTELSRAFLMKNGKKRSTLTLGLVALLYAFIATPTARFLTLNDPLTLTEFLGSRFLPTMAESLAASYLALLGGPIAALAYRGPLKAFHWFSPILPNLPWGLEALLGVLAPTIGFLYINQATSPTLLRRLGVTTRTKRFVTRSRAKKSFPLGWMGISILCVLMVWGSTGLLGFQPSVIASGSMRPTLDVGDIAITVQTSPDKIRVGDIIQYWRGGEPAPIIHRVVEIYRSGTVCIVTKGDANTAPDDPITPTRTVGKLIITIPKLGWASIYIKTAITSIVAFSANNVTLVYTTLTIASAASIFGIHRYRNQPLRRLRRRLKR